MAARALYTVIGGTIALTAYRIWPTWERTLVPEALARLFDAYRDYFQAIRDAYLHPGLEHRSGLHAAPGPRSPGRPPRSHHPGGLRRAPGSRARCGRQPHHRAADHPGQLAPAHPCHDGARSRPVSQPARAPAPGLRVFANNVDSTLYFLAAYLRGVALQPGDLPDLREDHRALLQSGVSHAERYELVNVESDRVTNSLNTLALELVQWVGGA